MADTTDPMQETSPTTDDCPECARLRAAIDDALSAAVYRPTPALADAHGAAITAYHAHRVTHGDVQ